MAAHYEHASNICSPPSPSATSIALRLKLCFLDRAKLFSLSHSHLTFSKLLSLVAQGFPETQNGGKPTTTHDSNSISSHIELSYSDEDGDTVIFDSEESFSLAAPTFSKTHLDVIKLQIHVKNDLASSSNNFNIAPSTTAATPYNRQPRIPCRHFQAGSCRYGSSCTFLHRAIDTSKSTKPSSLSNEFEIDEGPITFKRASEHESSSHLTSSEGSDSYANVPSTTPYNRQPRIPCRHFQAGSCRYGSSCKFLHNAIDNSKSIKPSSLSGYANTPTSFNRQPPIPCQNFQAGSCSYGSSCKFLHNAINYRKPTKPSSLSDEFEIDEWLITQRSASEHDNISYLTSSEGYDSFMCILSHPRLPQIALHQLVGLLTRPKLRTSLLKQATDKIYNAVIGSNFVNAMHSHIRTNVKPTLGCIEPYVFLCEELMSRTSNGWKEVPLDELKTLVDEVKSDSTTELSYTLARLLDHRAKKKRLEAVDEKMGALSLGSNFREMPIIPPKEQLLSQENPSPLPVNQVGLRYPNVGVYLDTHFKLMQEDCIATLRDGIHELRENSRRDPNIHVYTDVCLAGLQCGTNGMVFRVSFNANTRQPIDWHSAKRLMFGSLLCMSCDKFQTLLWAIVANRTVEQLAKSMVDIRLLENSDQKALEASSDYVMAESSAAYFEAYSHVLRNLQRPEMDSLPFQEHLIALEPRVKEPVYLKERNREDVFDFESAFPQMKQKLRTTQFHILQSWPEWQNSLDKSQMSALKHGLTKRLALIQGPPGTGKTFIGLLIVKIMLSNLKYTTPICRVGPLSDKKKESLQEDTVGGPILVICYTNHALDQFLEGIYAHEKKVVRVGGRSKSSKLEACNLQKVLYEGRHDTALFPCALQDEKKLAYMQKKELEEQILECANLINIAYVTETSLNGIATEEQVESLFFKGCKIDTVVKMWLDEQERRNRTASKLQRRQQKTSSMQNPFEALRTEVVSDAFRGMSDSNSISIKGGDTSYGITGQICKPDSSEEFQVHAGGEVEGKENKRLLKGKEGGWGSDRSSPQSSIEDMYQHGDRCYMDEIRHANYANIAGNIVSDLFNNSTSKEGKTSMKIITPRGKDKVECEPTDSAWTEVKARRPKPCTPARESTSEGLPSRNEEIQVENRLEMLKNHTDVWSLDGEARRALHAHWVDAIRHDAQERMNYLYTQFEKACHKKQEIENELHLSILRKARIVGMTTTAAARYHSILESLQAEIIVVEEAAEVLESHILACITASTKHLVLIGDHLQLRPAVAVHKLAVEHQLDVSLFERLVKGGVEYVTLEVQRRMRPAISELISSIYPMLTDHKSVSSRENIKGVKSNVFFLHHTAHEKHTGDGELGKVNVEEAQLVVELCAYLVKQEYSYTDIAILSMYKGQTQEIIRRLAQKLQVNYLPHDENQLKLPRVSSVDDYQGEECKIIILSLVRSNCLPAAGTPGKIGFLAVSNRVGVALSRARDGLFIFGNGDLLSKKSELWESVVKELQKSGSYGEALTLACQNHPEREIKIQKPSDFRSAPDGGCEKACEHQLNCGHACPKRCHPGGHDKIVCPKRCPRKLPLCDHQCQSLCHGFDNCPPCLERVVKELPQCGHSINVYCSTSIESVICPVPCPKILKCSHRCWRRCGEACTSLCPELVERVLPCHHSANIACHIDPVTYLCPQPCKQNLPDCQHICQGTCGTCKQGQTHIPCQQKCNRSLPCGHPCQSHCHEVCPPCFMPCQKRCLHSRCPKKCGYPCVPCMEQCEWKCRHHHVCKLLCHELCNRPGCNEPCEKFLQCGHLCLGLCGEPCPPICRVCTPGFKDTISLMMMEDFDESDRFVELQDCGHVFEVSGLDTWMQTEQCESGANGISPKKCPECRTPITRSFRYGNQVKTKLRQIEEVKKRILEFEIINEGIRLLQVKEYDGAVEKFVAAIEGNGASFEAYLGLGSALCLQSEFKEGIHFFQFVVRQSPLRTAVKELDTGKPLLRLGQRPFVPKKMEKLRNIINKTTSCQPPIEREAEKQLAIRALVQWATALSRMRNFPDAIKACEIVLKEEPNNKKAEETLKLLKEGKGQMEVVVEAMMKEVGGRGHWYQCPNGHFYVVGECGGPMQLSKCADCKATVGGQNHAPATGNTHSSIDGSTHSAWSDRIGLGDFNLQ